MKIRRLSLLLSIIMVIVSLQMPVLAGAETVDAASAEVIVSEPNFVHGNTVVAPEDTSTKATGADGWYSANKNVYWAGHNVSQSAKGSLSVNIIQKKRMSAFETVQRDNGSYSGVAFRVSHAHVDGQPNYTAELEAAGDHKFGFEITYYDSKEMAGNWLLCYMTWSNAENNAHKSFGHYGLPIVQYEGTDSWKRVRWTHDYGSDVTKWNFYSDGAEREDFKFYSIKGTAGSSTMNKDDATVGPTYIHDFTMLPIDEFEEYCAKTSDSYLTAEEADVISYGLESNIAGYNSIDGNVSGVDNRYSAKIPAGFEVKFSAPETALKGNMGKIVVECYAKEETNVTLNGTTLVHTGDLQPTVSSGSDNSYQKLVFLQSCITDGEYTLTADKDIQIASIHYEGVATREKANTVTADLRETTYASPQTSADGRLMFVGQTDKNTYYSWYTPAVVQGLASYKTQERKDDSGNTREDTYSWIPFRMGASYAQELRDAGKDEVGYEVIYFDAAEMEGKFLKVNMDWAEEGEDTVNRQSAVAYIPLTGSGNWKVYRSAWDTYGGWFAPWTSQPSRGNPNFEFMVCESNEGAGRDQTTVPAVVRSFTVMPADEYTAKFAADGDAYINAENGAVISCGITSSADGKYQGAGVGQHGYAFGADGNLTFTVDSMLGKENKGTVTVKCWVAEDGEVTLDGKAQAVTGGAWQEIVFTDVDLSGELTLASDSDLSVASVKVKSSLSAIVNGNSSKERGYNVNVSVAGVDAETGSKLLAALYDENGAFITVGIADIETGVESYGFRANTDKVAGTVKIFLWSSIEGLVPICAPTELAVK